jgi:hypothetical protein
MAKKGNTTSTQFRIIHRYLGFFLAGIMAMYSISGSVLIFRNTDFLKNKVQNEKQLESNLDAKKIGEELKIRDLKVTSIVGNIIHFQNGTYNSETGVTNYTSEELPYVMNKMTKIHKATSNDPLYFLNLFFAASLFFFVLSSFWMFRPETEVFKKGLYFAFGGLILTLILIFV